MNVSEWVYKVSTTWQGRTNEDLVTAGNEHSGCLERELAKRLAIALDEIEKLKQRECSGCG